MRKIIVLGGILVAGVLLLAGLLLHAQDERRGRGRDDRRPQNPVIVALDANGDGEISAEEVANAPAALKRLDKDGDGELSREELRPPRDDDRDRPEGGGKGAGKGAGKRDREDLPRQSERPRPIQRPDPVDGFVLIPGGEFEMGDHHDLGGREHGNDEVPIHKVRIGSFHMATTETTNQQYCDFLDSALGQRLVRVKDGLVTDPDGRQVYCDTSQSDEASEIQWDGRKFTVREGRGSHPMVCIRWHGAVAYCNWLSAQKGLQPCCDLATGKCDFSRKGFRLPTEAEWEYAGRGGQYGPYFIFPWGDDPDETKANWPRSGDPYEIGPYPWTTPVGFYDGKLHRKADFGWPGRQETYQTSDGANGYGLYDMSGNVWEWVYDWYDHHYYASSPAENPKGPDRGQAMSDGKPYRVLRSGSWYNGEWGHGRVSNRNPSYYRGPDDPNHRWYHIGFRVARNAQAGERRTADRSPQERPTSQTSEKTMTSGKQTIGLFRSDPRAFKGYTLFAPKHFLFTYLMDNEGRVINTWESKYEPGQSVYLLPNGHLLHCCFTKVKGFTRGGEGGRLEEYDWEGNLVWEFDYASDKYLMHHDIAPLPNGNILALVVEKKSYEECLATGFDSRILRDRELYPDYVIEVQPTRPKGGKIVWEWHVWDHLIQEYDRNKPNYGKVADHPELISVNVNGRGANAFWNHMNSIDYNPELDQILLSVRGCSEIWIIDHSTTTKEGAGHKGGRYSKGGDLLYRWGNPAAYGRGDERDQMLFQQHDSQWIPPGCPGAGNILIFNNGLNRLPPGMKDRRDLPEYPVGKDWGYSSVDEIVPPVDKKGNYILERGAAYGPAKLKWTYVAEKPTDFFAEAISGCQRLPNGNTLICDGTSGVFFEITPKGEKVWEYVCPVVRTGPLAQGQTAGLDHRAHKWNAVFKIQRYAPDYPGLAGKDLTPKDIIPGSGPQMPEREMRSDEQGGGPDRGGERPPRGRDDRRSGDRRDDGRGRGGRRDD